MACEDHVHVEDLDSHIKEAEQWKSTNAGWLAIPMVVFPGWGFDSAIRDIELYNNGIITAANKMAKQAR